MNTEFDKFIKEQLRQGNTEIRKIKIKEDKDSCEVIVIKQISAMQVYVGNRA